ncbi:MAG: type II toxin-antitoxin system VapC family toxin [Anaerosomatales bacterium]|nr:type II toxin-antitoxin system VapC family toxin [Coriobacteriia bacterium]
MTAAVIDSSVVHKWLHALGESRTEEATHILHKHLEGSVTLLAPSFMPVEVANSLRWKRRIEPAEALELIADLASIDIALFDSTYERVSRATTLAYEHGMSVYDALFLALAEEMNCPLFTADQRAFAGIDSPVEIRLL